MSNSMAGKRLLYVTNDCWWDTDITVLPAVSQEFDLEVFCVSPKNAGERKYKTKSLPGRVVFHDCKFQRYKGNIGMAIDSIVYGLRVVFASLGRITIWVPDNNFWLSTVLVAFMPKKNLIVSLHNYVNHSDSRGWEQKIMDAVIKRFHNFHFHSPRQWEAFCSDFPYKKSFSTVMPVKDFGEPAGAPSLFKNGKKTFLFFGGIRAYKRPDLFLQVSNRLKGKANFAIAGNGPDWEKVKGMIDPDNPVECMIRFIENEEIPELFTSADFLVLPYEDITQSGPLLTAYNYCLPVIASSLPYFEDMVDNGITGFIFNAGDVDSLEAVVKESIAMTNDDYDKMVIALRSRVDEYKQRSDFPGELRSFLNRIQIKV